MQGACRFRDPELELARTDITRFPHAVLEVKLSLAEGTEAPAWVRELTENPNRCTEVHKFSKFIHGTCTLFPALVQVRAVTALSLVAMPPPPLQKKQRRRGLAPESCRGSRCVVRLCVTRAPCVLRRPQAPRKCIGRVRRQARRHPCDDV